MIISAKKENTNAINRNFNNIINKQRFKLKQNIKIILAQLLKTTETIVFKKCSFPFFKTC
ncbi:hypothetical protein CLU83_2152 [Flavobacterium sp. 1]|nr:hypothetical protein CLU83_2152 [Flavobacterium sp. 1]